ncbi:UNVERIFIED_CONTAM: hypothetical protein HHA_289510 [Hammondia hammondi]|eukprot:XP_008889121.1 hypothetical protein HHA_289510 [Hammondia hammondi]
MEAAGECTPSSSSSSPASSFCAGTGSSPAAEGVSVHPEHATDTEMPEASCSTSTCAAACAFASEKQEVEDPEELAVRPLGKATTSSVSRDDSSSEEESDEEEMSHDRRHAAKMRALQEALQRDLVIDGDAEIDDLLVAAHVAQIENQLLEAQQKAGNLRKETMEKLLSSGKGVSLSEAADGEAARAMKQDESAMKDEGDEDDEDDEDPDDQEFQALMKNEERFRQRLLPHPESTPCVAEALRRAKTALSASTASASSGTEGAHAENATHAEATAGEARTEGKKGADDAIGKEGKEDYADKLKGLLALIGKEPEEDEIDEEEEEGSAKGEDGDALGMWTGINPIEVEGLPVQVAPDCAVKACGVVHALVGSMLVVKGDENSNPMDLGSVVCLEDKTVLGAVADTFGPVAAPFYVVFLPEETSESRQKQPQSSPSSPASRASSLRSRLSVGLRVYSDVSHSSFLLGQHGQVPAYLKSLHRSRLHYASGEEDNSEDEEDDDRMSCVSGVSSRSASSQRSLRGRGRGLCALGFRKDGDRASRACLKETYEDAGKEISPEEEAALELQKQQREQQQKLRTEAMLRQFSQARGEGQKPPKPGLSRASGGRSPPAWAPPVGGAPRPAFAVPGPGGARGAQGRLELTTEPRGDDRRRSGYPGPVGGEGVGGAGCVAGKEKRGGVRPTGMHAQASGVPPPPSGPEGVDGVRGSCPFVCGEAQHAGSTCGASLPSGSLASPCRPLYPQPPAPCHVAGAEARNDSFALRAFPHSASGTHMQQVHGPPSHRHTGCCHGPQAAGPGCSAPSFSCVHACACTQTHASGGGACSYHGAPGVGCTGHAAGNASAFSPGPAFPHASPPTSGFGNGGSHALGAGGPGAPGQFHCPLATSGVSTPQHGSPACPGPSFGQPHAWAGAPVAQSCFSHSHGEPAKAEANRGTAAVSSVPPWARACGQPAPPTSGAYTPHGASHPPPSSPAFPATGQGVRPPPPPPAFR